MKQSSCAFKAFHCESAESHPTHKSHTHIFVSLDFFSFLKSQKVVATIGVVHCSLYHPRRPLKVHFLHALGYNTHRSSHIVASKWVGKSDRART